VTTETVTLCSGGCGAPAPENAYLDPACVEKLRAAFRQIANSLADLELTATRQSRTSSGGSRQRDGENENDNRVGPRKPDNYITGEGLNLPFSESAADLLDDVVGWLRSSAIHLAQLEYGDGNPSMPWPLAVASWLAHHSPVIAQYETISEEWLALASKYARDIRATIDNKPERTYYGACMADNDGDVCTEDLYSERHRKTIVCAACGAGHDRDERQAYLDELALDTLLPLKELQAFAKAKYGVKPSRQQMYAWRKRNHLIPKGHRTIEVKGEPTVIDLYSVRDLVRLARIELVVAS
jgi:hypothetical protein